ncbi:sugar ABC transporter substrate-binding protein [Paenibacillus filicis]|uniref:Sugar ABC transporter substrate-binding protein n=1 Tax=Paenibacillus gyeongsangnamensis TaxID=3388067 RepID=A0ABT4QIG6_9BACL|nr:sugar ABC transporter substrate-binding protein [Paenibacillus filicis]MCZ8516577.1 sugar ABC transporter substrate-binding protein [Paenibacillus filicis]
MKKTAITAVSVLLAMSLSACGGGSDDAGKGAAASNTGAKPGEKTKITYWTLDRHDADYIKEVIAKFNSTNKDNIEVELVVKADDYAQALDLAFSAAEAPDVFRVKENTIQTYYKKGYMAPIDEYLTEEQKKKFPVMPDLNQFDGKMYSLPNYGSTMRLVYNKDLFDKAGITKPPTTLAELVEDAKKLTAAGKATGAYGFALPFKTPSSAWGRSARVIAELSGYGGFGYDFKTARYDFSGFKEITKAFKQMRDDGSTLPGMEALDIDPLRAQFAEGKIGMYLSFSSEPGVYKSQFPAKINWAAAPAPTIDGSIKGASGFLGGQWLAINKDSKKKDAAWKFINYMYGDDILQPYHEKGYGISMVPSIISKVKKPDINGIEGFLPNKYDGVWPIVPTVTVQGVKYEDAFWKYILEGGDLDKVIADLNKRYNEALDKAIANGEVKAKPDASFDPAKMQGTFAK